MENAWNEYLKLERDVEQLKQTLQEQHRRTFFFQVTKKEGYHLPRLPNLLLGCELAKQLPRALPWGSLLP